MPAEIRQTISSESFILPAGQTYTNKQLVPWKLNKLNILDTKVSPAAS